MKYLSLPILAISLIVLSGCGSEGSYTFSDFNIASYKAKKLFDTLKEQGLELEDGPCISEEIISGWSVDISHLPQRTIDLLPENQCQNYLDGTTQNLILLDQNGVVIPIDLKE